MSENPNPVAVQRGDSLFFWCPGCDALHSISTRLWEWDGDLIAPTISPSILARDSVHLCHKDYVHETPCELGERCLEKGHLVMGDNPDGRPIYGHIKPHIAVPAWGDCHSFLKNGQWQFLGDSTHKLAGMTAQMVPLPDWLVREAAE